jgi:hypothetical protein
VVGYESERYFFLDSDLAKCSDSLHFALVTIENSYSVQLTFKGSPHNSKFISSGSSRKFNVFDPQSGVTRISSIQRNVTTANFLSIITH